jgi:signal transduction histidine kinase/DNA-binding NarL/FixJ family response regulator
MGLSKLQNLAYGLSHLGIPKNETPHRIKRIVLCNQIAVLSALVCLPFFFLYQFLDMPFFSWLTLSSVIVCLSILWINSKGGIGFSRLVLITYSCLAILGSATAFGRPSGFHLFLLPLGWMALVLFDWQEKKSIAYGIVLGAIPLLAFELFGSDQGYFYTPSPDQTRLLRFSILSLTLVGQILEVFYFFQANRRSEAVLSEAGEVAKSADRAKSQFLANMSHEIRTPLNGILGMSSQLLKSQLRNDQHDMVKSIHKSGLDLMVIISEILDMSKIEAGKMRLETIAFEPREAIQTVFDQFKFEAHRKLLDFSFEAPSNLETYLMGDPVRLKQVLNNLLSNAIKFTDSGMVSLKVWGSPIIQPGTSNEADLRLRFEIKDTGIGIPAEKQNQLFKSFSQADESITRTHGGTGLGLYISKQIVELMGGKIAFHSQLGEGSVFNFEIPFSVAPISGTREKESILEKENPVTPAGLKILIVEDHPLNQKVLAGFLAQYGCKVDAVGGGQEALDEFKIEPYNLILMDCHMPGMDGFECTREFRNLTIRGNKPIIIGVTADAMHGTREKCLAAGMDDVLTKPILSAELDRMLSKWVGVAELNSSASNQKAAVISEWVDTEHLRQMDEWIRTYDPNFWIRTMEHFRDSANRLIRSMQADGQAGRMEKLAESAHALKGLCLMMGLSRISNICKHLENEQATQSDWKNKISDLEKCLEPSLAQMQKYLQGL